MEESGEGPSSMAEGEFGFDVELGHGLVLLGEKEEGVVTEAFFAAWGGEDLAFYRAVANGEDVALACGCEDAVVSGATFGQWDTGEEGEEVEVVALVGRVMLRGVKVVVVGKAGRADSGGPV